MKKIVKEEGYKLSPDLQKLLDLRERESLAGKNSVKSWDEIKQSIISQKNNLKAKNKS